MLDEKSTNRQEKDDLFNKVIINNPPNLFVFNQLQRTLIDNPNIIIPFIGAGFSAFAYKPWGLLLQDLLDQLADRAKDDPVREQIQDEIRKGNFFEAADRLESLIESDVFYFSLASACSEGKILNEGIPSSAPVQWIPKVFANSRIITTNYDSVLEYAFAMQKKYLRSCTPRDSRMFFRFMPRRLFKIHGSYDSNYEDIVLTAKSYDKTYDKGGYLYSNFKHVVRSSVLFFLGASLRSDKTLDILKEIADEFTISDHYCGNMHYAVVRIDDSEDKGERRKELAKYKILPILYSDNDHRGISDRHAIVSVILERLYNLIEGSISDHNDDRNFDDINGEEPREHARLPMINQPINISGIDGQQMAQDPLKAFLMALSTNNINVAETLLSRVEQSTPREIFLTKALSPLASRGSTKAANILFADIQDILNGDMPTKQKVDIMSSLVGYCTRMDIEDQHIEDITRIFENMLLTTGGEERAEIYNQLSRMHYGKYITKGMVDSALLDKAKLYLSSAIDINGQEPSYFYNLAIIQRDHGEFLAAAESISKCIMLNSDDLDYLSLAYRIYKRTDSKMAEEMYEKIRKKDLLTAQLLEANDKKSLGQDDAVKDLDSSTVE